jgi:DNA-binding transcriptional LysR family regulator
MDEYKIKTFCKVAETKSFSKASKIMGITQPAVSLQIQAIEEIFGIKLIDRSGSVVKLTKFGISFYEYAKEIDSLYMAVEKELHKFTNYAKKKKDPES